MKAEDTLVTNLLEGAKQFIVPIFQRDYSWGTKPCQQLWKDVIRVGNRYGAKTPNFCLPLLAVLRSKSQEVLRRNEV